jgi:hypothetical protein
MLLLTLAFSSIFSCIGIHYRRLQPQREALAKLEVFHPKVDYNGDNVWLMDFKGCEVKPGDGDLIHLQGLRHLTVLDLEGSSISDAGLRHLYAIKTLGIVLLDNTQVTQQGVDDLKRALPEAHIYWSPEGTLHRRLRPSRSPAAKAANKK